MINDFEVSRQREHPDLAAEVSLAVEVMEKHGGGSSSACQKRRNELRRKIWRQASLLYVYVFVDDKVFCVALETMCCVTGGYVCDAISIRGSRLQSKGAELHL